MSSVQKPQLINEKVPNQWYIFGYFKKKCYLCTRKGLRMRIMRNNVCLFVQALHYQ